jgi:hypothetical protein
VSASVAQVPARPCAVQQPPAAEDVPPRGGETDTAGQGPGRWRICLQTPAITTVEGTAWCKWNTDRTGVDDVSGLPSPVGGVDYDAYLPFASGKLEVHLTDQAHGGLIANYEPRLPVSPTTESTHKSGTVSFDLALQVDPDSAPPPGAPTTVAGSIAWLCGDAPAAG